VSLTDLASGLALTVESTLAVAPRAPSAEIPLPSLAGAPLHYGPGRRRLSGILDSTRELNARIVGVRALRWACPQPATCDPFAGVLPCVQRHLAR
jgi:hypothetical protein